MALTNSQLYLMNQLYSYAGNPSGLYIDKGNYEGMTVREIAQSIQAQIKSPSDLGNGLGQPNYDQVQASLNAIVNDPAFAEVTLQVTRRDNDRSYEDLGNYETGAHMSLFTTAEGEGIVLFEGSATTADWYDNALGATSTGPNGEVATPLQQDCLDWYNSPAVQDVLNNCSKVTVTGHSKGGNEAKFVTLLAGQDGNRAVDSCVSFDGQGFSDEFIARYKELIARNQGKILNINAANDYVNILLNDVGVTQYVKCALQAGELVFCYHSTYAMWESFETGFNFAECGAEQSEMTKYLDDMLNSALRSFDGAEKQKVAQIIGNAMAIFIAGGGSVEGFFRFLSQSNSGEVAGRMIGYFMAYASENNSVDQLVALLNKIVPGFGSIMNRILDILGGVAGVAVAGLAELILGIIGFDLPHGFVPGLVTAYIEGHTNGMPGGQDARVKTTGLTGNDFKADPEAMRMVAIQLQQIAGEVESIAAQLNGIRAACADGCLETTGMFFLNLKLMVTDIIGVFSGRASMLSGNLARTLSAWSTKAEGYGRSVQEAANLIENAEDRIRASVAAIETSAPGNVKL